MPNRLDPNQARQKVGPDLDPICFQRLSANDKTRHLQAKGKYLDFSIYEPSVYIVIILICSHTRFSIFNIIAFNKMAVILLTKAYYKIFVTF